MKWLVGSVVCAFLLLTPMVGMFSMPWAPIWFGQGQQGHATVDTAVGQPNTLPPLVLPTFVPTQPTLVPVPAVVGDRAAAIIAEAMRWIGVRYQWGGCSVHGVDCSCAVRNWLRAGGIESPRTTITQIAWTRPVALSQVQPTDLLYWDSTCSNCGPNPTHVSMVLDATQHLMIHAGDPVHIESYDTPYWRAHFNSAGRIP